MNRLSVFLQYQRLIKRIDLQEVSNTAKLSVEYLKRIERGDRKIRDVYTIDKLARGYRVKLITLVNIILGNKELNLLQKIILKIGGKK